MVHLLITISLKFLISLFALSFSACCMDDRGQTNLDQTIGTLQHKFVFNSWRML